MTAKKVSTAGPTAADESTPAAPLRLAVGDPAPDFQLPDAAGASVALSQFRGRRVVLYFYPAAGTPGCTTQATDFRDHLAELNGAGIEVLAVSPDPPASLAAFRDAQGLDFPLLSDPQKAVLQAYGAYGAKSLYGKTVQGVIRSTFVIGPAGEIERAMYNVKATGHVAKLLRELDLAG